QNLSHFGNLRRMRAKEAQNPSLFRFFSLPVFPMLLLLTVLGRHGHLGVRLLAVHVGNTGNHDRLALTKRVRIGQVRIRFFQHRIRDVVLVSDPFHGIARPDGVMGVYHLLLLLVSVPEEREEKRREEEKREQEAIGEEGMGKRAEERTKTKS
ncbi:hypothetical protein, partial [Cohnella thermotolerans]|uniref:hypothetical protein n=1 Tax=Cohnella thermotolerans TaxID=329858 RepID=UPI003B82EDBF